MICNKIPFVVTEPYKCDGDHSAPPGQCPPICIATQVGSQLHTTTLILDCDSTNDGLNGDGPFELQVFNGDEVVDYIHCLSYDLSTTLMELHCDFKAVQISTGAYEYQLQLKKADGSTEEIEALQQHAELKYVVAGPASLMGKDTVWFMNGEDVEVDVELTIELGSVLTSSVELLELKTEIQQGGKLLSIN